MLEYEDIVVRLATSPSLLRAAKERVGRGRRMIREGLLERVCECGSKTGVRCERVAAVRHERMGSKRQACQYDDVGGRAVAALELSWRLFVFLCQIVGCPPVVAMFAFFRVNPVIIRAFHQYFSQSLL
jgi:hypothetical protein